MKKSLFLLLLLLWAGCGSRVETVDPGRGVEREVGSLARIFPSGEEARVDRHGLWRGMQGDRVAWEVRYTRGLPTGPYREWNEAGDLIATWPYNWDGEIEGWARWFEEGESVFKLEITPENRPDTDMIGSADAFRRWVETQAEID